MNDHERFLSLFNQQVTLSLNTLEQIPAGLWTSIPADSETNYLGQRISRIGCSQTASKLCSFSRISS